MNIIVFIFHCLFHVVGYKQTTPYTDNTPPPPSLGVSWPTTVFTSYFDTFEIHSYVLITNQEKISKKMLVHGAITITYVHASTLIQGEGACVHSNKIMHNMLFTCT